MIRKGLLFGFFMFCLFSLSAQQKTTNPVGIEYLEVRGMEPRNKPPHTTYAVVENGDTIPMGYLTSAYVFPKEMFRSARDEKAYQKLVRDVKRVYPLSRVVYCTLLETMDYIETLPNQRAKDKHLAQMQKDLYKEYEPTIRKMTYSQGKILLKLINRECSSSPYELIKAYRGTGWANTWQFVGKLFSADLKAGYDPEERDYMIERIVIQIEQGQL